MSVQLNNHKRLTVIKRYACDKYKIEEHWLRNKNKNPLIIKVRRILYYSIAKLTTLDYREIAKRFDKDRNTVRNGIKAAMKYNKDETEEFIKELAINEGILNIYDSDIRIRAIDYFNDTLVIDNTKETFSREELFLFAEEYLNKILTN